MFLYRFGIVALLVINISNIAIGFGNAGFIFKLFKYFLCREIIFYRFGIITLIVINVSYIAIRISNAPFSLYQLGVRPNNFGVNFKRGKVVFKGFGIISPIIID